MFILIKAHRCALSQSLESRTLARALAAAWRGLALQPRLANAWRLEGGMPTRICASCRRGWSSLEPAKRPPPWAAHGRSAPQHRRMSPEVARTLGLRVVELLAAV